MLIKKIELNNFMCYYGTSEFEFSDGINVIIGDNGYGKSKLFDAFHWVLYDEVFDAQKKVFLKTKDIKGVLVSDKAKANIDGKIQCSVKITFINAREDQYIVERTYFVNKHNGSIIEANNSTIEFSKKLNLHLQSRLISDQEEKEQVLKNILPEDIKPYMWFQGEAVESIIDFSKSDSLTKAIDVLSNISYFDKINKIAESLSQSASAEHRVEVTKHSTNKAESERLENEIKNSEKKLSILNIDASEKNDVISRLEQECDILLEKHEDSNEISKLESKNKDLKSQLSYLSAELLQLETSFKKKMFSRKWVLKGTSNIFNNYATKFSIYEAKRLELITEQKILKKVESNMLTKMQSRLPIDVPEPIYVQKMLDQEKCLVCDRPAPKESEEWLKIKELLVRNLQKSTITEISLFKHDFSREFKSLYQTTLGLFNNINTIDEDINDELGKIESKKDRIKELNNEQTGIENKYKNLLDKLGMKEGEAANIINEYRIKNKKLESVREETSILNQKIRFEENRMQNFVKQQENLSTGKLDQKKVSKKEILSAFEIIAKSTRERVFDELIKKLEKEANKHYNDMTKGNKSAKGIIHLRRQPNGNFMPELANDNGEPIVGSNTGNIIAIKLSVIMAIISAKSHTEGVDLYTLITDAPTSVFGEDYTIGFVKTVSKVYKQSIIMSKEFFRNEKLRSELLTNPEINLGKVYQIEPSIKESERLNRNNLETKIIRLN